MRLHLDISKFNSILFTLIFIFSMTESTVLSYYFTLSNPISVILLTLLIGFNFKKIKYDYPSLIFIIPTVFFCLMSVVASDNLHLGGYNTALISIFVLICFSFYGISFNLKLMSKLLLICMYIILVGCLYFIYSKLYLVLSLDVKSGIFLNSNSFGMFLAFSLIFQFIFIKNTKWIFFNFILFFPILLYSNSRGSLFMFIIFLLFYNFYNSKSINLLIGRFLVLLISAIVFMFVFSFFFSEVSEQLFNKIQSSGTTGRLDLWLSIIGKIFSDFIIFLFGTGPATTILDGKSAHNSYLNEASNMGLLYVLSYISLIAYKYAWFRNLNYKPFLIVVFPVMFLGIFESILFLNSIFWIFILFLNLSFKKIKKETIE